MTQERKTEWKYYLVLIISILMAYSMIWMFTPKTPFMATPYNSYALQADRWLHGHLDLGQNYTHLELAIFDGKYFVSFPPLPSVILIPFVLIFGTKTPDYFITTVAGIIGAIFLLKLLFSIGRRNAWSVLWVLFATIGGNFLLIGYNGDVWLIAQTLAFMFTSMSIYCAATDKESHGKYALFLLACAFGCRPLQIIYLPLICYLLYQKCKQNGCTGWKALLRHWTWLIAPLLLGIFYMVLNYARFGNPIEFGHNFLPEHTVQSTYGQFHPHYFWNNFAGKLWKLPSVTPNKTLDFPRSGFAFWLVSPIYLMFAVYFVKNWKTAIRSVPVWIVVGSVMLHHIILCMHATMGGIQWGLRYTVDAIPALFFALSCLMKKDNRKLELLLIPLLLFGYGLNALGTVIILNGWSL